MTFSKSHLGMCMVTRGYFIVIKIFPGCSLEVRTQGGQLLFCPLPPLARSMQWQHWKKQYAQSFFDSTALTNDDILSLAQPPKCALCYTFTPGNVLITHPTQQVSFNLNWPENRIQCITGITGNFWQNQKIKECSKTHHKRQQFMEKFYGSWN